MESSLKVAAEDAGKRLDAFLASQIEGWSRSRLRRLIDDGETKTIALPKPLPVHIVYFTAIAGEDGAVKFREDVYGIDEDLVDRLRGRARVQAAARAKAEKLAGRAKPH